MFSIVLAALGVLSSTLALPTNPRIVNGTDASAGEIKYIVSVRYLHSHNCGGSILDSTHVLTAAHCVKGDKPSTTSIQFGILEIDSSTDAINVIQVADITYNEDYVAGNGYKNDIALLKLESPIPLGEFVQPIRLPQPNEATPANEFATLSGWGLPHSGGKVMTHLQVVHIRIYSDEECEEIHKETGPTDRDYNICAGVPEGGKGQCSGDSGGPLVIDGVQMGIVSWSVKPCTVQGYPGVFTKVSTQIEWIKEQLRLMP